MQWVQTALDGINVVAKVHRRHDVAGVVTAKHPMFMCHYDEDIVIKHCSKIIALLCVCQ